MLSKWSDGWRQIWLINSQWSGVFAKQSGKNIPLSHLKAAVNTSMYALRSTSLSREASEWLEGMFWLFLSQKSPLPQGEGTLSAYLFLYGN